MTGHQAAAMDNEISRRHAFAVDLGREAGALALHHFRQRDANSYEMKGHQDYLTEADGAVERLISRRIAEQFPDDSFLGEETGGTPGNATWIVDPIDGTANFARGIPHFCVSIGFVRDGVPEVGVINGPATGELFTACRHGGAFLNGAPLRVSGMADMRQATVELGWSMRRPIAEYVAMVGRITATGAGFRRAGSGALGLAYVAAGRIDAYAELHINSWDVAAGILLVREAGGWANDFFAGDGMRSGNPVLACTPELRRAVSASTGIAG